MKFAHLGDCHLGSWREPELSELNFKSFQLAIEKCIKEKVEFILITGDLFDSAYPPIETLKDAFREFRRVKEANIPVFLIAGSHDYSVSGKTFLDVLDKAGFCKVVSNYEERDGKIILLPTIYKNVAIYGYPGKKSGLEVDELEGVKIQDSPGLFKILMLHTAIRDAVGTLPIKAVNQDKLPKVDYLALSHLHINYVKANRAYSGPIYPNNISELEELKNGSFCIFDNGRIRKEEIKIKEVISFNIEVKNALNGTEEILQLLEKSNLKDKIVIIKVYGILEQGKNADIDFKKVEDLVYRKEAFILLKSTSRLHLQEAEFKMELLASENLESQIIKKFEESNPSKFNSKIPSLLKSLQASKIEDEKSVVFEERLLAETRKVLEI